MKMFQTIKRIVRDQWFRAYRIAGRLLIKYSNDPRPSSAPYISGDGFRKLGDHIHDETGNCDPNQVKEHDIVFVGAARSKEFLTEMNPQIQVPYTLVSHNSDELIDESYLPLLTSNIQRWYSYNVGVKDERIVPLPLGLGNKHYYATGITRVFDIVIKKQYPKQNKIFYWYSLSTNICARQEALEAIQTHPLAQPLAHQVEFGPYLHESAQYKFIQSPRGSSIEGHRTWEAMYIGSVPIVLADVMSEYFQSLNAPMMVITDWSELDSIQAGNANTTYRDIIDSSDQNVLTMDYWAEKIKQAER